MNTKFKVITPSQDHSCGTKSVLTLYLAQEEMFSVMTADAKTATAMTFRVFTIWSKSKEEWAMLCRTFWLPATTAQKGKGNKVESYSNPQLPNNVA
mmetsp:Transcript_12347/g.23690  ORF Transcript_12347/g.23690 Transcript_12347/m.23690 type:complete len:96 (-) Transcript_12347:3-290(-)